MKLRLVLFGVAVHAFGMNRTALGRRDDGLGGDEEEVDEGVEETSKKLVGNSADSLREFMMRRHKAFRAENFIKIEDRKSTNCIGTKNYKGPCYRMAAGVKKLPKPNANVEDRSIQYDGINSPRMVRNYMFLAYQETTDFDGHDQLEFDGAYMEIYNQPECNLAYPAIATVAGIMVGPASIVVQNHLDTRVINSWKKGFNFQGEGSAGIPGVGSVGLKLSVSREKSYYRQAETLANTTFVTLPRQTCAPSQLKAAYLCDKIEGFAYFYSSGLPKLFKEFSHTDFLMPAYDGELGFFKIINGCIDYLKD